MTSGNILAIASHLQYLESSLSNILIEAAMKLTTLTDSSIFILIDGPNGRKFAGTDRLTDVYAKEGLMRENGDVELKMEKEVRLRAETVENRPKQYESEPANLTPENKGSRRKRPHPNQLDPGHGSKVKRIDPYHPALDMEIRDGFETETSRYQDTIDATRLRQKVNDLYEDGSREPAEVGGTYVRNENTNYYEIEDSDVQPYDSLGGWSLTDFLVANAKAQTLKTVTDSSIIDRGSESYKLLTSLMWDVAKEVTELSEDIQSSKSSMFVSLFEEFWSFFPFLDSLQNEGFKVKMKEHGYTPKAHLKKTLASCLRHKSLAKSKAKAKQVLAIDY